MTPRKLSDVDKQQILELYRQPGETTSTLASRYGVSNSTISRILKSGLAEDDYEKLIQAKRGARALAGEATLEADSSIISAVVEELEALEAPAAVTGQLEMPLLPAESETGTGRRSRRRSVAAVTVDTKMATEVAPPLAEKPAMSVIDSSDKQENPDFVAADTLEEILAGDLHDQEAVLADLEAEDLEDDLEDDLGDDLDGDDLDDDDLDDDDLDDGQESELLLISRVKGKALVQVLPLAEASIPRTCYLVVDRSAELITRPLKEFGDLGQIPEAEMIAKTLPVFDNHRIAKRYSNPRTQRVIKLPDGRVLQKASSHLQAKGITRLLIDGQVYSL